MRAADRLINDITDDVMRDVVTSVAVHESQQVAANFHEIHVVQRLDTLRRCSHVVEMLRVRAYLDIWKTRLAGKTVSSSHCYCKLSSSFTDRGSPLTSIWPHLRCGVGLEEYEYEQNCF